MTKSKVNHAMKKVVAVLSSLFSHFFFKDCLVQVLALQAFSVSCFQLMHWIFKLPAIFSSSCYLPFFSKVKLYNLKMILKVQFGVVDHVINSVTHSDFLIIFCWYWSSIFKVKTFCKYKTLLSNGLHWLFQYHSKSNCWEFSRW